MTTAERTRALAEAERLVDEYGRAKGRAVEESVRAVAGFGRLPDPAVAAYVRESDAARAALLVAIRALAGTGGDALADGACGSCEKAVRNPEEGIVGCSRGIGVPCPSNEAAERDQPCPFPETSCSECFNSPCLEADEDDA